MRGLMLHSPADVLAQAFIGTTLLSDPEAAPLGAWPAYVDIEPDFPDEVATFKDNQGREADDQGVAWGPTWKHYGVQIMVRGRTSVSGRLKANRLIAAMEDPQDAAAIYGMAVSLGGSTYRLNCISDPGTVLPLGFEEGSNRFLHSINVIAVMRQLT